jgi:ATPase family associated with various cellular activities (AAA)/AAA+ lid domain
MEKNLTRGQVAAADVSALLRARNPLLWIPTREEARAEALLFEAAASARYVAKTWDCAAGPREIGGRQVQGLEGPEYRDIGTMLAAIEARARNGNSRELWILRDAPVWLEGLAGASPLRALRNLARLLPSVELARAQAIMILSPSGKVPDELAGSATVVEWPLPDREEIAGILDLAVGAMPEAMREEALPDRELAIDAALGLTSDEAASCYAKSLVQFRKVDPVAVGKEKKGVISRERVLEWIDPIPGGLDVIGGLENMKEWLLEQKLAFSPEAKAYGLPAPKGILIVGVPGTGKSLTAKAVPIAFECPLLKLDLGALKSKWVGSSEENIRKALKVIGALGRSVVWIDEIEKALAGATQGAADGGVSADALGVLLNWMQEQTGGAFVVATANKVEDLPPELLRAGRFDVVWWVDLPNEEERVAILKASLKGKPAKNIDLKAVAAATEGYSGAEIASVVPAAMFLAFKDGARPIGTADLLAKAKLVVPLSKTAPEKIAKLREWAVGKARPASKPVEASNGSGRMLDLD